MSNISKKVKEKLITQLKVLSVYPDPSNSGVGWYRLKNPLTVAEKQGLIECKHHGYDGGQTHIPLPTPEEMEEYCKWADVIIGERNDTPQYLSFLKGAADHYGIPAVLSIDDDVQAVRPYNPGYKSFCPNSEAKKWNIETIKRMDGMIYSTQQLVDVYGKYNNNYYVCPNSLDFKWRDKYLNSKPEVKKKKEEIRLGWAGSSAHWENLNFIQPVIYAIMEEYDNVTFHYTGLFGDLFTKNEFQDRFHRVEFADLDKWPEKLARMGLDIALAPLTDNLFNRSKSNLRCLEYQACKYTVVASDVLPYRYLVNGKTGIIAKEQKDWYEALKDLIENPDKRKELAENGYNQAKKHYNIDNNCKLWVKALKQIVKGHKKKLK